MNECFISVDIETTGPTPGSYSMFEIGATRVENPEWDFNASLKLLPGARFEQEALRAIGRTEAELEQPTFGADPREVMQNFADWVKAQSQGHGRPIFVANNAPFDWMFVAWYFEEFGIENPFGYSAFDMKAYFMGLTRCSWSEATLVNMARYAGVTFKKLPHRALDDAIIQSQIFARLLRLARK